MQIHFQVVLGRGLANRDDVVYDFDRDKLSERVHKFIEAYNAEVDRLEAEHSEGANVDDYVDYDKIKWSETLKTALRPSKLAEM